MSTVRLAVTVMDVKQTKMNLALGGGQVNNPSVRLAWFDIPAVNNTLNTTEGKQTLSAPAVRLAQNGPRMEHTAFGGPAAVELAGLGSPVRPPAPIVRLAHKEAQGDGILTGVGYGGVDMRDKQLTQAEAPALLVSYYYLEPFIANRALYRYRDWVMDSGAFSAHNSGVHIDLNKYVDKCLELMASDKTLTEVFSLDVIPKSHDPIVVQQAAEQSLKNCEEMWRQGVPAIPTFHRGEQEEFLYAMAKTYPKIAIGGVAMLRGDQKRLFCEQVFARVWPKKIHGLGMSSEELVYGLPFHSVDATNWELAPCAFGNWMKFGSMSVRGSNQDLRSQVKFYMEMEAKARVRWAKQMAELDKLSPSPAVLGAPTVRLAVDAAPGGGETSLIAFGVPTTPHQETPTPKKKRVSKKTISQAAPTAPPTPPPPVAEVVTPKPEPVKGVLEDKWANYGRT